MSLTENKGVLRVRYTDPVTKKEVQRVVPKGAAPLDFAKDRLKAIQRGEATPAKRGMSLSDKAPLYIAELDRQVRNFRLGLDNGETKIRPKRCSQLKSQLEQHILPRIGELNANEINARDINRLQHKLKGRMRTQTVKPVIQLIFRMLKWLYLEGHIDSPPPQREDIDKLSRQEGLPKHTPSMEDVHKTILACDDLEHRVMIRLAAECGIRAGEVLALTWRDVKRGLVSVKSSAVDKEVLPTKTDQSARSVRLSDRLKADLAELRLGRGFCQEDDFLFTNGNGRLYTSADALKLVLYPAQEKAGVQSFGWHGLRRFYINHLLNRNVMKDHVQRLAGHVIGSEVTDKHYREVKQADVLLDDYVVEVG